VIVRLELDGPPVPWARPFQRPDGRRYQDRRTRIAEEAIAWACAGKPRFGAAEVGVSIAFYIGAKGRRADIDNLQKTVLDGLVKGGLIDDDRQVSELRARRLRLDPARTVIVVSDELGPPRQM
jgi:Holliday junction resolvase RusA-like endonuclease